MSLVDRCKHFLKEFPTAKINPTLLRQVYKRHGIRKKKYRWYKTKKIEDREKRRQELITMKRDLAKARNTLHAQIDMFVVLYCESWPADWDKILTKWVVINAPELPSPGFEAEFRAGSF